MHGMQEVRSSILLVSTIQKSEVSRNLNDSAGLFCIYRFIDIFISPMSKQHKSLLRRFLFKYYKIRHKRLFSFIFLLYLVIFYKFLVHYSRYRGFVPAIDTQVPSRSLHLSDRIQDVPSANLCHSHCGTSHRYHNDVLLRGHAILLIQTQLHQYARFYQTVLEAAHPKAPLPLPCPKVSSS